MSKNKEMDIVHIDGDPLNNHIDNLRPENAELKRHEWINEYLFEIEFAVQEWGIQNELRLFGIKVCEYYDLKKKVLVPHAKGLFTDSGAKDLFLLHFDVKKVKEKISITRKEGFKYPLRVLRTDMLNTRKMDTVSPSYEVLIGRGIILPFQSHVKGKKRDALHFEESAGIKAIAL